MSEDPALLEHIRDAAHRIVEYTAAGQDAFFREPMRQDAVIRNIEIIGEAVKNLSAPLRVSHPDVPWKDIARMRDKLIHHYLGVKLQMVWRAVVDDVPALLKRVESIRDSLPTPAAAP